jgi:hypothetical protein
VKTCRCLQVSNLQTVCRSGVFRKEREAKTYWPRGATAMADVARQNDLRFVRLGWLARAALFFWDPNLHPTTHLCVGGPGGIGMARSRFVKNSTA